MASISRSRAISCSWYNASTSRSTTIFELIVKICICLYCASFHHVVYIVAFVFVVHRSTTLRISLQLSLLCIVPPRYICVYYVSFHHATYIVSLRCVWRSTTPRYIYRSTTLRMMFHHAPYLFFFFWKWSRERLKVFLQKLRIT